MVGRPDEKWGEVPIAFVTSAARSRSTSSRLQEFLRGRLARFKVPKVIEVMDELPKTAPGRSRSSCCAVGQARRQPDSRVGVNVR